MDAMTSALETALLKRNRQTMVDFLVNNGALIKGYWVQSRSQLAPSLTSEQLTDNRQRWARLVRETVPRKICNIPVISNELSFSFSRRSANGTGTNTSKGPVLEPLEFEKVSVRLHVTNALARCER